MKQKRNAGHRWVVSFAHLETKYPIGYLYLAKLKHSIQTLNILIGNWKILPNANSYLERSSEINIQAMYVKILLEAFGDEGTVFTYGKTELRVWKHE